MSQPAPGTAAAEGLAVCHSCGKVQPVEWKHCQRCDAHLHLRKPQSIERTCALTLGAVLLYFPANLLPIMKADQIGGGEANTIIGGVALFWSKQAYPIAIVVFTASIVIPILKLIAIVTLCLATRKCRQPRAMTRIYRLTELIGRWSMTDVFVVAILVAVVQLGSIMSIEPGPAALAFAGVVILTMLATMSFDPRLIWDAAGGPQKVAEPSPLKPAFLES